MTAFAPIATQSISDETGIVGPLPETFTFESVSGAPIAGTPVASRANYERYENERDYGFPNYLTGFVGVPWQEALGFNGPKTQPTWAESVPLPPVSVESPWAETTPLAPATTALPWHDTDFIDAATGLPWHSAQPVPPLQIRAPWHDGAKLTNDKRLPWRSTSVSQFDKRVPWRQAKPNEGFQRLPWQQAETIISFGGSPIVVVPPVDDDLCYYPDPNLLFAELSATSDLLFYCELHPIPIPDTQIVPIRKVYIVLNNVNLKRVAGNLTLPTLALSLSIDVDSWTWGFSATLPGSELAHLEPDSDGTPVELEAKINGSMYRFLAESLATERTFGRKDLRVSGRGKNAILDAPYAPALSFGNPVDVRTGAQLMDDALTLNGVSIGWDVDFGLDDWTVPAGAWSHQGTHITAINAIAAAAGGYVQPHPTLNTLRILKRYPVLPWNWLADVAPDFELPADVAQRESIAWAEKVRYNRVFLSGTGQGVLARVTRDGTAGDLAAPTVTDALITDEIVARQRGGSILADTGRVATVTLRLPVLAETNVIEPGNFVRYVDGGVLRLGLVRSTQVDVSMPEVWQSIGVETHE